MRCFGHGVLCDVHSVYASCAGFRRAVLVWNMGVRVKGGGASSGTNHDRYWWVRPPCGRFVCFPCDAFDTDLCFCPSLPSLPYAYIPMPSQNLRRNYPHRIPELTLGRPFTGRMILHLLHQAPLAATSFHQILARAVDVGGIGTELGKQTSSGGGGKEVGMGQTARLGSKNGIGPMIMLIVPLQTIPLSCGQRGRRFQTDGGTHVHALSHALAHAPHLAHTRGSLSSSCTHMLHTTMFVKLGGNLTWTERMVCFCLYYR